MSAASDTLNPTEQAAGMALMVTAMLLGPGLDVIAKLLMERLSPAQVAAGRFLAQSLILLPLFLGSAHRRGPVRGHVAAGAFLGLALVCINIALRVMPVANAIAIFFVAPLILTLLGVVFLRERIGWRRIAAILAGLCGALVVLRPNVSAYGTAALWPLATAVLFSCYLVITRRMSRGTSGLVLQFWTGVFATLVLSVGLAIPMLGEALRGGIPFIGPLGLSAREWALFVGIGALASVSHQLLVRALARIEAGLAAPFQYLEIVSAVLLGWLIFGDFPDPLTWTGTAIIIGAGLYVFHRSRVADA